MSTPPDRPKIFHITHVDNLAGIVTDGGISCDARRVHGGLNNANIGMSNIKERRLHWTIGCLPGRYVGEFVPFYLCPRSLMLFIIARANHPQLTYRGGQAPIVHLQADLHRTIDWAEEQS